MPKPPWEAGLGNEGRAKGCFLLWLLPYQKGTKLCQKTYRFNCHKHLLSTCCVPGTLLGTSLALCHLNRHLMVAQACFLGGVRLSSETWLRPLKSP